MANIVLTTIGSLGDLHPFLAVAVELKRRGHKATVATSEAYRAKVEAEGLPFLRIPPDFDPSDKAEACAVMDLKRGTQRVMREIAMPAVRGMYDCLAEVAPETELIVTSSLTYAAPIVAEKFGIRWLGAALAPIAFLSRYDMPIIPQAQWLSVTYGFGPRVSSVIVALGKMTSRAWSEPVHELRRELGLKPDRDPLFTGQFSPHGNLALFSRALGAPQRDWPARTHQTGFAVFDSHDGVDALPAEVDGFLRAGDAPIVFTLGSAAVMSAGDFYRESAAAARKIGRRAVLLVGNDPTNLDGVTAGDDVLAVAYAPYSQLFHRACAVVHQGGVGTTGQGLRAGRPTLIVPFSHDQPDNAARVRRLGVSLTVPRRKYNAASAADSLAKLLNDDRYTRKAQQIGDVERRDRGAQAAADVIDASLSEAVRA